MFHCSSNGSALDRCALSSCVKARKTPPHHHHHHYPPPPLRALSSPLSWSCGLETLSIPLKCTSSSPVDHTRISPAARSHTVPSRSTTERHQVHCRSAARRDSVSPDRPRFAVRAEPLPLPTTEWGRTSRKRRAWRRLQIQVQMLVTTTVHFI